jgi:hypothetical protein
LFFPISGSGRGLEQAAGALTGATGLVRDLMLTVGPGADGLITSSRQRLLACLRAGDADAAATEIETHLRALQFMELGGPFRRPAAFAGNG